jgi:predicted glycosyl hydrolase (DUF1957 family)
LSTPEFDIENARTYTYLQVHAYGIPLLCLFAKLRKATISFVLLVCRSVRCMEQLDSEWVNVREIRYFSIFQRSVEQIQVSIKYDKNNEDQFRFLIISCSLLLRMRIFQTNVDKIKNHISYSVIFFS